jgi:hypothetical protein
MQELAGQLMSAGFDWDPDYIVPMEQPQSAGQEISRSVLLRGRLQEGREQDLEARPDVVHIWSDAPAAPFAAEPRQDGASDEAGQKNPFTF